MRLWSISPKYLDTKGLLALWREALLAKKVLEGKTNGYKNHPQLIRFKQSSDPLLYINIYLKQIYDEGKKRVYKFDYSKIDEEKIEVLNILNLEKIKVTEGQIKYEFEFLKMKLKRRDFQKYLEIENIAKEKAIEVNPIFEVIVGEVEKWEKKKIL